MTELGVWKRNENTDTNILIKHRGKSKDTASI